MKQSKAFLAGSFLACAIALSARSIETPGCGTHAEISREQTFLHRQSLKAHGWKRQSHLAAVVKSAAATNQDYGNIAVIEDSDGVITRPNQFDLDQKTITFTPAGPNAAGYRIQSGPAAFDAGAADRAALQTGMGDDDSREIVIPFGFPFFGAQYRSVFVNSDGNLTFGKGDAEITDRSLGRMVAGPPRIAPLFADLDPSSAQSPNGVRVLAEPSRIVITWSAVPLWESFGAGPAQTFQVGLYPDGRIEFTYSGAGAGLEDAVVGIAPGGMRGTTSVISLLDSTSQEFSAAVAERFSNSNNVDIATAAQKFFATHDDAYDYLVIYNTAGVRASSGAVAYEVTTRNHRSGYGDGEVDIGAEFGSPRRLQAVMNMGPLSQYPADPAAKVGARGPTGDTPLTVLGHEAGHLFLAFTSVPDPDDPKATPMLGRDGVHWAFTFNSDASLLEGNRIQDNGAGASPRFMTIATVEGYSLLDQYLMGFLDPREVPPTFAVLHSGQSASRAPQKNIGFSGDRLDIRVEDVIAVAGRRTPDSTVAQRHFRFAFLLIVPAGATPSPEQLSQVDAYRTAFEDFYNRAAGGRAWADTSLRRALQLSAAPASGVVRGASATARLALSAPASTPLTILLEQRAGSTGVIQSPPSVVIPSGASEVSFQIQGERAGVVEFAARPADPAYETAYARIQVLDSTADLQLSVVSGDQQGVTPGAPLREPVVFQVTDINRLPYSGVRVSASVSGGVLEPASAVTDQEGKAAFRWTPDGSGAYELKASITGAAASEVVVHASGRPAVSDNGVVNAASYTPGITPGAIAALFGSSLAAGATEPVKSLPLPYNLANVEVTVGGNPVQLFYVSDTQVNFLAPAALNGDAVDIVVKTPAGASASYRAPVLPVAPGIFFDSATGDGAILAAGTLQTTREHPVAAGDAIEIYATGLGPTVSDSGFERTLNEPRVTIAGAPADIIFSGRAPGYPGLYQVNAIVPGGLAGGIQPLTIEMNGSRSNEVRVHIR
jgi:uncharacterized protein (TIGR03437 family)